MITTLELKKTIYIFMLSDIVSWIFYCFWLGKPYELIITKNRQTNKRTNKNRCFKKVKPTARVYNLSKMVMFSVRVSALWQKLRRQSLNCLSDIQETPGRTTATSVGTTEKCRQTSRESWTWLPPRAHSQMANAGLRWDRSHEWNLRTYWKIYSFRTYLSIIGL